MKIKILKELEIYQQFFLQFAPAVVAAVVCIAVAAGGGYLIWLIYCRIWYYLLLSVGYLIPLVWLYGTIFHPHLLHPFLQKRVIKGMFKVFCVAMVIAETILFWQFAKVLLIIWAITATCTVFALSLENRD